MRNGTRLLVLTLALLVGGCTRPFINGSGTIVSEPRNVAGFTSVALSGSGRLQVEHTGTESLTVTADDNLLPLLISEVRGAQLILGTGGAAAIRPSREIVYRLTVKGLNELVISGSASAEVSGINAERFTTTVSGSGNVSASGTVSRHRITISGSGSFQGQNLQSTSVTIIISGSGNAVLAVTDLLDATVSGSGSIEYVGNPTVTQKISGSGSIRRR